MKLNAKTCLLPVVVAMAATLACVAPASSMASGPAFTLHVPTPEYVTPGEGPIALQVTIQNTGDEITTEPFEFTYKTGAGVTLAGASVAGSSAEKLYGRGTNSCSKAVNVETCAIGATLPPGAQAIVIVRVRIAAEASGPLVDSMEVSGGGASAPASAEQAMTAGQPAPFAITAAAAQLIDPSGAPVAQAGADPAEFTTSLRFTSFSSPFFGIQPVTAGVEHFKDVTASLPPGLIGNPSIVPQQCTAAQLNEMVTETGDGLANCPADSQVGIARVSVGGLIGVQSNLTPIFDMVPPPGTATELGFNILGTVIRLDAHVRPGDYGRDMVSRDPTTTLPIIGVDISVWGTPSDPSHDPYRDACLVSNYRGPNGNRCPSSAPRKAFLRMPTSCSGSPIVFGARSNSYEHMERYVPASFSGPTMTGCGVLPFAPAIDVAPSSSAASSPTGATVKLSLPQFDNPGGLAEADLKKAVVTLPEGMVLNPSSADGLQACDDAHLNLESSTPAECPNGSKIGTVSLHTPLISELLEGSIYVRPQISDEPASGNMFRLAIEIRDDARGLDFKIPGQVSADPSTGRLTTTFDENPQLPFEDIALHFKSGARAPLVTPDSCGTQTTEAHLYSWARPDVAARRLSSFSLSSGPEGTACVTMPSFQPGFSAGATNVQAGHYTAFVATFKRADADQRMKGVSVTLPKGLLGSLVGLPLCGEAQANAGTCSAASEIGSVTAGAGAGPSPFYVSGGKAFITGPYEGAPFGLSVVVPTKAGPFDLGTVVVRAKVQVDPSTAQLVVTTDPLPQIVGGIPINLRLVNVTIDRSAFLYNPTSCTPMQVGGAMTGAQGVVAKVASHFQVTNCAALKFQPTLSASTSAKTSRKNGASLHVLLVYPKASFGTQANIKSVHVQLPKILPSRLSTLNHACPDAVFNQNPASCPAQSRVGYAKSTTSVLPVPLEGPAYFVSHGGEKFPELVVVLQGYGITIDLAGETFISKADVTSSTFRSVPDVPVSSFELTLPEGPSSALAANASLCATKLVMPTVVTGQNGATLKQTTRIAVNGCKPAIRVVGHSVKGTHASIRVSVPSAGTLVATGTAIERSVERIAKPGIRTIGVRLSRRDLRVLANNPNQRVNAKIMLRFTPKHGAPLTATVTLLMG